MMPGPGARAAVGVLIGGCLVGGIARGEDGPAGIDVEAVARLPFPGTVTPSEVAFTPDGSAVTYLMPERPDSLSRVGWRAELTNDREPRIVARPPGEGTTEGNVSKEEELRRERQRLRATGIAQVVRAAGADVAIFPLNGDLYLQRGDGPLEQLTSTPSPEIDPKPNADASRIAYARDGELHVMDVADRRETRLTDDAQEGIANGLAEYIAQEELDRSSGFWWSPDGARIAYQQTDERHIPAYTITHHGDDPYERETHRYPFAGAENARVKLGVVSTAGGPTRWYDYHEPGEEVYLARVDWEAPERLLIQVLDREQKRLRLVRVDLATGVRNVLIDDSAETWINLHNDLRLIPDTGEIVWSTERTGLRRLELRDRDGMLIRSLTPDTMQVDGLVRLDETRREAWFHGWDQAEGPHQRHLYRVSLDGGPPIRVTRTAGTHQAVVGPDGERIVDIHSTLAAPPRTILLNRDGEIVRVLHDAADDPRVESLGLARRPPTLVDFTSRDGVTLHGGYYAPSKVRIEGAKVPLIVMVYGGPHVQTVTDSWAMTADLMAQFLTERGFAVWKCDNRGSARRGHPFEAALNRRMGHVEVDDQVDGVRHVAATYPEVDARRVGITGGSYGGYMTLRCLQREPEVFKAGVAVAPVTDWDGYDTAYTERYMGTPRDNPEGYGAASVLTDAAAITGDLMVIHGLRDENVHFRHSSRLATALIEADRPFTMMPMPASRHSSRRVEDRRYIARLTAAFFEDSLGRDSD